MTPKAATASPPPVSIPGMIVLNGRTPGAAALGCPARVAKPCPRLFRAMPVPGTTTPEPKPR